MEVLEANKELIFFTKWKMFTFAYKIEIDDCNFDWVAQAHNTHDDARLTHTNGTRRARGK